MALEGPWWWRWSIGQHARHHPDYPSSNPTENYIFILNNCLKKNNKEARDETL